MSKKIVLFLSAAYGPPSGKIGDNDEIYPCPPGSRISTVKGERTNDAPVRYLLKNYEGEVESIICIVTPEAERTAWDRFVSLLEMEKAPEPIKVPFPEGADIFDNVLPEVIRYFHAGDEILLDTTGGHRHSGMFIVALVQVLTYCNIPVAAAVYSNHVRGKPEENRIVDISRLFGTFDLIGGMQELTNLGSVRTLQNYFSTHFKPDPDRDGLLSTMKEMSESIAMCRTGQFRNLMDRFNTYAQNIRAKDDPLMHKLLDAFQATYQGEMTVSSYIRWCLRNDMVQQALTLYTEQIPAYLQETVLDTTELRENISGKSYEAQDMLRFYNGFLNRFKRMTDNLGNYLKNKPSKVLDRAGWGKQAEDISDLKTALDNLSVVLLAMFPDGKTFTPGWAETLPPEKSSLGRLKISGKPVSMVNTMKNISSKWQLSVLFNEGKMPDQGRRERFTTYIQKHAEAFAPDPMEAQIAPALDNLVVLLQAAYPGNGEYNPNWVEALPEDKRFLNELAPFVEGRESAAAALSGMQELCSRSRQNDSPDLVRFFELTRLFGAKVSDLLSEARAAGPVTVSSMVDAYRIVTIDCMEDLLPSYVALNYQIKCSVEKMKRISRDYLYVKMARNKTNHARDEVRDDQAALTAYMCRNEYRPGLKYPDPQLVSLPVLQDIIGRALDVIDGKDE